MDSIKRFIQWIKTWWHHKITVPEIRRTHLEPKYWPEVYDYIQTVESIIHANTIEDDNIHQVNERIVKYIVEQINRKGTIDNLEERFLAINTVVDRVLVVDLGKIVGLKQQEGTRAEFSEATQLFKKRLAERHAQEKRRGLS